MNDIATLQNRAANKEWIDRAKGICIILVVMMHTALGVAKVLGDTGFLHAVVAWTKPFRMPDFFLLSGFLAGGIGAMSWRAFVDRRIVHYLYFYVVWLVILTGLKLAMEGVLSPARFAEAVAIGMVEPFGSLWFIYVLPAFMIVTRLAKGGWAWAIGVGAFILHVWAATYPGGGAFTMESQATNWVALDSFALFFVFFYGGYCLRDVIGAFTAFVRRSPAGGVVLLTLWAILHSYALHAGLTAVPGLTIVAGLLGAFAILAVAVLIENSRAFGWLAYCGKHSLAIYLAFVIPMSASRSFLIGAANVTDPDILMVLVLAMAIVVPLVLERAVRSTPLRFLFSRPGWTRPGERNQS